MIYSFQEVTGGGAYPFSWSEQTLNCTIFDRKIFLRHVLGHFQTEAVTRGVL